MKRVLDEPLRVEVDVLAEEASVRVFLRWRLRGVLRWEEKAMILLGDYRYGAEIRFPLAGDYEFAVRVALAAGTGEALSPAESLVVERTLARSAAWVALASFRNATGSTPGEWLPRLDALKLMGFDIAILPPLGGREGGIDAGFGTAEDVEWLLRAAAQRGMELALTLTVGDATALAYGGDFAARWEVWAERARRLVALGVRALACPDAHLAPAAFWGRLVAELRAAYPDLVFLAGGGGSRKQRIALARIGFSQSLSTIGQTGSVVELKRLVHDHHPPEEDDPRRSCLWPEFSGVETTLAEKKIRIALAALLSPAWGISENWIAGADGHGPLASFVSQMNRIRHANPVLRESGTAVVCHSPRHGVLPLLRGQGRSTVLAVLNVAPEPTPVDAWIHLPRALESDCFAARDLFTGRATPWHGSAHLVGLDGFDRCVRVFRLENEEEFGGSVLP